MKKCVIALCGESFRTGGQNSRTIGDPLGYDDQKIASLSIVKLCDLLKNNGYDPVIISETYKTVYSEDLKNWLSPYLFDFSEITDENKMDSGLQWGNIKKVLMRSHDAFPESEFVFLSRHDLVLKDFFYQIFNPEWDRIMWPSITWKVWDRTPLGNPRVSDTMHFIPQKYMGKFLKMNYFGHDIWDYISPLVGFDAMGFMVNTQHDSDPAKDWNPIYWLAGRQEAKGPSTYP